MSVNLNFPNIVGTDTSDATATASDIAVGKTAYVNDVKVTGTKEDAVQNVEWADDLSNFSTSIPNSIKSIIIPYGVTSIGTMFKDCTSLTSIIIPNTVTSIESNAFSGCTSLTSITIPDSVTSIGYNAFYGTALLENQTGVKYADTWVIGCDTNVTSVELKEGTRVIINNAFFGCTSLTSIIIPNTVTSIEGGAFSGCTSLTSITIPDSVTSIGYHMFKGCSSLTSITIPDSVTSIGQEAFGNCTKLTSVTIPNGVTSIGASAFYGCPLENLYYKGTEEQWSAITKGNNWYSSNKMVIHYNS